jgi:phosphohistidine swiveling domain-containing protein
MTLVIPIQQVKEQDRSRVGGKAYALSQLMALGMDIPKAVCISAEGYARYVAVTGLRERIMLELNRKRFQEMRWEEMWDASLRIRNMFLRTPIPAELDDPIRSALKTRLGDCAVVVRSSAPEEDSAKASFAGLHESYINLQGLDRIMEHIRLVWASLWSDAALLYRKELGLQVEKSSMAVLVQEIVVGERSGVIFGMNPNNFSQVVLEAVYGLNAGLVDGTVEPDRWLLDRKTGRLVDHIEPNRENRLVPADEGTRLESLPLHLRTKPPLDGDEPARLYRLVMKAESHFGSPQDVEWTFRDQGLHVLQSRPITTAENTATGDKRPWYLSLRRSLENLKCLRLNIESELIPGMIQEADLMSEKTLGDLTDIELAEEIDRRRNVYEHWVDVYWKDFIPFAHGMRLFGQVYNDTLKPDDPFEFMGLLGSSRLLSIERNRLLAEVARRIRRNPQLMHALKSGTAYPDQEFEAMLDMAVEKLGIAVARQEGTTVSDLNKKTIIPLLLQMADSPEPDADRTGKDLESLTGQFLSNFDGQRKELARDLLELGRASYKLRDNDNIYLGRIEMQMKAALTEAQRRISKRKGTPVTTLEPDDLLEILKNPGYVPHKIPAAEKAAAPPAIKARQLVGQPAGPGIARGKARLILVKSDLFAFRRGEILVCDAIDPNMTFIVPLSAGVVERRGGMLIHGAIIAREYGLPCVTGVASVTSSIRTGQSITVDGYLGIVIME